MRVYINKEERAFLTHLLFGYIEDCLADEQFDEDFEFADSAELELINSLLSKLHRETTKENVKIRYTYEKIQDN